MSRIVSLLLFLWQLPQNLLGVFLYLFSERRRSGRGYYLWRLDAGISLGHFVFLPEGASDHSVAHEKGHQRQSLHLGPLYLLVIGLPSFFWAVLHTITPLKRRNYYSFYTEAWAEKYTETEA